MESNAFTGSITIITGAASGMGRYMAIQASQRGARVIALDVNAAGLEETKALGQAAGVSIETKILDVSDAQAIEAFAQSMVSILDTRKLILINNAGVALLSGTFAETSSKDFEWLVNINLWGVIRMTKAFYPYLIKQNEGHIVNISSVFGLAGVANNSAYCTAKFGVRGFTETIRMELMGTGVGTTCVHPGGIKTNIVQSAKTSGSFAAEGVHEKTAKQFLKRAPTTAEDAAKQILDAVEKKQEKLVIGQDGRRLDFIVRLFPVRYTKMIKEQMDKMMADVRPGK